MFVLRFALHGTSEQAFNFLNTACYRSTPRRDTFWGGGNDVTAALGFERDGETTIIFRKKIKPDGFTDHEIVNEDMHVIWAVGQEPGEYSHVPKSGLEEKSEGTPSIPDFYRPDELKYHGRKNRGIVSMNFFEEVSRLCNRKLRHSTLVSH